MCRTATWASFTTASTAALPQVKNPVEEIPGILAGGWTQADFTGASARESDREWSSLYGQFRAIWKDVEKHDASWPFQEPVDTSEVEVRGRTQACASHHHQRQPRRRRNPHPPHAPPRTGLLDGDQGPD